MSRRVPEALVDAIGNNLAGRNKILRERKPMQDIVLMVVWLLATPDSFRSVFSEYIKWPNAAERGEIKEVFNRVSGFPGAVGCVDGTHIYITAPVEDAVQYPNRYRTYSMNVQAIVDNNLLVRDVHVEEVGSIHDRRVFRRSAVFADLLARRKEIDFFELPFFFLGGGVSTQMTGSEKERLVQQNHTTEKQKQV
ncbi:hypothetical protein FOCC_FOCC014111 [Frankliniella occidentalis]|nr:hypothetical protein FOCC_FOCC014111 [Frankliniella occidentalis]